MKSPFRSLVPLVPLLALGIGGCAALGSPSASESALAPGGTVDDVIVADLVGVLGRAFDPLATTVQVNAATDDPLSTALLAELLDTGFGVQRVVADEGANFLELERGVEPRDDGGADVEARIAVGAVEVRRAYTVTRAGDVRTASPLRVAGTRLDDEVGIGTAGTGGVAEAAVPAGPDGAKAGVLTVADPSHDTIEYVPSLEPVATAPIITLLTPDLVARVAASAAGGPSVRALNANEVEIDNLFYSDDSNFGSAFDRRERVARRVIVFADDSMNLGEANKRLLAEFVTSSVRGEDLIGLVGCSNGPTALEIGNEGLAIGRARRVTEELLAYGVPRERIYDEGCWAPVSAGDRFPGRGVVLELWRPQA